MTCTLGVSPRGYAADTMRSLARVQSVWLAGTPFGRLNAHSLSNACRMQVDGTLQASLRLRCCRQDLVDPVYRSDCCHNPTTQFLGSAIACEELRGSIPTSVDWVISGPVPTLRAACDRQVPLRRSDGVLRPARSRRAGGVAAACAAACLPRGH